MASSTSEMSDVAEVSASAATGPEGVDAIRREVRRRTNPLLRWALIVVGTLFAGLGIVGVFLPIVPSTPFFLVAAACYGRSSERAYIWLMTNRYFGNELREYYVNRAATRRTKAVALGSLWGVIGFSAFFVQPPLWAVAAMAAIASAVTVHLIRLKRLER